MLKMSKINLALAIVICGLFCSCHEGIETKCYDSDQYVFLRVISMTDIDSVHFILNNQRVCEVGLSKKEYLCNEDDCPVWNAFSCGLGPLENIDFDSSKLSIEIFINGEVNKIETDFIVMGGNNINAIPEQDSAKWFSYKENPLGQIYGSPKMSNRMGCFDSYCVTTLPIEKEEFCYDLSN